MKYMLIKYIKSILWRVVKRLSYIQDAWCLKVKVEVDKTKYLVMSRDQNSRGCHNIKMDNISFERVAEFKYLATNLTIKIIFLCMYCASSI